MLPLLLMILPLKIERKVNILRFDIGLTLDSMPRR